ncbi:coenzyme B12-dependent class II ribonucleotide reductase [Lacticaseibacillus casei 21/1]|nr:coenzyme B12-dependent class II ribonucleotide reductase [Lacticaseibacillus casei 21/1]
MLNLYLDISFMRIYHILYMGGTDMQVMTKPITLAPAFIAEVKKK